MTANNTFINAETSQKKIIYEADKPSKDRTLTKRLIYNIIDFSFRNTNDYLTTLIEYSKKEKLVNDNISNINLLIDNMFKYQEYLQMYLNYKMKIIRKKEFEDFEHNYLLETAKTDTKYLKEYLISISKFLGRTFDAGQLAIIYNCNWDKANEAIFKILK